MVGLTPIRASPDFAELPGAQGATLHARVWRATPERATVILLHGVVSHAGWLDPLASRLAYRGYTCICPDRRGSGRNLEGRGDMPGPEVVLDDLDRIVEHCEGESSSLHLAAVCWGAAYAVSYLGTRAAPIKSLALLAPSIFPSREQDRVPLCVGDSGDPTLPPNVPLDAFTRGPEYQRTILPDPDRLRRVSPRFNGTVRALTQLAQLRLLRLALPTLWVLAESDRLVDNVQTARAFERLRMPVKRLATVPGEHGLQFDAPDQTVSLLADWLNERLGG